MKLPRREKTRKKMGAMIGLSALLVVAMGTTTMAWYSVQTSISVQSSSVSIRTALQYYFYAYKGNGFDVSGAYTNWKSGSGYSSAPVGGYQLNPSENSITNHYTEVDELFDYEHRETYKNALTKVTGLWPGYKMSFAIKIEGLTSTDQPELTLNALQAGVNGDPGAATNPVRLDMSNNNSPIYMAQAIMIYSGSGASLSAAITSAGRNSAAVDNVSYRNYNVSTDDITSNWWNSAHVLGKANPEGNANSWWYFFTVEFSDDSSTYYKYDHSTTVGNETTHYYTKTNATDSSCYENLSFSLGTLDLK